MQHNLLAKRFTYTSKYKKEWGGGEVGAGLKKVESFGTIIDQFRQLSIDYQLYTFFYEFQTYPP